MNSMTAAEYEHPSPAVTGQKYAYATASLVLGIACFVNILGLEKGILAIIFGLLALRTNPPPRLQARRIWSKVGVILGSLQIVSLITLLLLNMDRVAAFVHALRKLTGDTLH